MITDPIESWSDAAFPRTLMWDDRGVALAEGIAWEASASGPGRGIRLARAIGRLEGQRGSLPMVMGALAFEDASPLASPWGELPGARLWLPARLRIERDGLEVDQREAEPVARPRSAASAWHHAHPVHGFKELVEDAAGLIREGAFRKVVVARAVDHHLPADHRDDVALARLKANAGNGACVYAQDLPDGSLYLGATPELLLAAHGHVVETHALAGTCAASDDEEIDAQRIEALVASTKERKEHGLVVEHLVAALRSRCRPFAVESSPHPRRCGQIIHLETRIAAELADPDYLDVIAALHPTPATCGLPASAAASWLARHERMRRGLYCGALGWIAPDGCRAVVLLRGALLSPDRKLARCFAGVGVVETSDPQLEWEETELKLALIRRSLRVGHA
jgi:isochorismate synthase